MSQTKESEWKSSPIWKEGELTETGWHRKANSDVAYYPENLIVFVHGIRSHWYKAWKKLPELILDRLGVDCDLFSYSYPSGNFEAGCYKKAAAQLYEKLITPEFQHYRHISFIVHSTGGLVVKRAILSNHAALTNSIETRDVDPMDQRNLILRTRRIINFGVPHRGGSRLGWLMFTGLSPLLFPIWTGLHFWNKIMGLFEASRGFAPGYNWIAAQLTWWWKDLVRLEESFGQMIMLLDERGMPRPISSDFIGNNDQAIAKQYGDVVFAKSGNVGVRNDATSVVVRGTHSKAKEPESRRDFKMDVIERELRSIFDEGGMVAVGRKAILLKDKERSPTSITDEEVRQAALGHANGTQPLDALLARTALTTQDRTIIHVARIEKNFDIITMVDGDGNDAAGYDRDERRSVPRSWLGSQAQVLKHLQSLCAEAKNQQFVVTGAAGVGKSSVLRRFATNLCASHLANKSRIGHPLYMPLFRYGADSATKSSLQREGLHWDCFASWWCEFANGENDFAAGSHGWDDEKVQQAPDITPGWLHELLTKRSTVVILDGVDDFLSRNSYLGHNSLSILLGELKTLTANAGCEIVLGVRSSMALPEYTLEGNVLEVARLSDAQAERLVYSLRDQSLPVDRLVSRVVRRIFRHYKGCSAPEQHAIDEHLAKVAALSQNSGKNSGGIPPEVSTFLKLAAGTAKWETVWRDAGHALSEILSKGISLEFLSEIERLDRDMVGYSVRALLDRIADPQARKLVLTPLILAKLVRADRFDELQTPGEIFEATLRIAIEGGNLPGTDTSTNQWLDLLTLVGHVFFLNFWVSRDFESILHSCQELHKKWQDHQKNHTDRPELAGIVRGFSLVQNPVNLRAILDRTVFLAVSSYRFEHREWEDYLAARHLSLSIQHGFVEGLCGRGSWTRMHFLIGDMLPGGSGGEFPLKLIEDVYACAQSQGLGKPGKFMAQVPIGNLLGVMGHSAMALLPTTLDRLLAQYLCKPEDKVPPLVELVALNTIGFRCLRHRPDDLHWVNNTRMFLRHLGRYEYQARPDEPRRNALVLKVAWLLAKALSNSQGVPWPTHPPEFDAADKDSKGYADALKFTTHMEGAHPARNVLDETMQRVFINLLPEMEEENAKALSCTTYLPTIVAAEIAGLAVSEVSAGLDHMLGNSPKADELFDCVREFSQCSGTPEVASLWEDCRKVYRRHQGLS